MSNSNAKVANGATKPKTKTIKLESNERAVVNAIKNGMRSLETHSINGLEKAVNIGREFLKLRQFWNDRLSSLYREQGVNWKQFVSTTIGKDYTWLTRLANCAKIKDSDASVYEGFLSDAKVLGFPVTPEGLIAFANGKDGSKGNKGKTPPADVIRFNGLEAKFKDGKFEIVKGDRKKVEALVKYLQGELKNM
jgi:hypothetical protein